MKTYIGIKSVEAVPMTRGEYNEYRRWNIPAGENPNDAAIELTNKVSLCRKNLNYSPHIRKCVAYINKNLGKKLTVNSVAKHCKLSSDYLSKLFKDEMGVNLSAYITHQKLELAQTLLWEGCDNDRVCEALGFSSQSHFISLFKKEYGITPREYVALVRA